MLVVSHGKQLKGWGTKDLQQLPHPADHHVVGLCDGTNWVVAGQHALLPTDSHMHMGHPDHPDITGAVPDGKSDGPCVPFNQIHYVGLLRGR